LKTASLNKDIRKVRALGPYAAVISRIINQSLEKKLKNDKLFKDKYLKKPLFKGLLINKEEFDS
jgi:hypothetical protein